MPPWLTRPHATLVTLGRLGRPECMQVVAGVAAAHGLSAGMIAAIVAKTDGVPSFVEEPTRSVMESAGEDSAVPALSLDRRKKAEARSAFATAADISGRQGAAIFERPVQASLSEFPISRSLDVVLPGIVIRVLARNSAGTYKYVGY